MCVGKKGRHVSETPRVRHTFATWTEQVVEQVAPSQAFRGVWYWPLRLTSLTRSAYSPHLLASQQYYDTQPLTKYGHN